MPLARPTRPLTTQPAGYVQLARYSSLNHLWRILAAAAQAGREIALVRGDQEETARRRIGGYTLAQAGIFLDTGPIASSLEDDFVIHPALVAFLAGNPDELRSELNNNYLLQLNFTVALTSSRDFICRPEFKFVSANATASLPKDLPLKTRRFGRDEINLLLLRASGLA